MDGEDVWENNWDLEDVWDIENDWDSGYAWDFGTIRILRMFGISRTIWIVGKFGILELLGW